MDANIINYFLNQGPAWVLFIMILFYVKKQNEKREQEYRDEITINRQESKDREGQLYKTIENQNEVLNKFSEKYDVIIDKLGHLEQKLGG